MTTDDAHAQTPWPHSTTEPTVERSAVTRPGANRTNVRPGSGPKADERARRRQAIAGLIIAVAITLPSGC